MNPFQRQVSSNDLLKSLLEEPIKRSWLCRSTCNSSESDFSLHKRTPDSSEEGEQQLDRFLVTMPGSDKGKASLQYSSYAGQQGLSNGALLQRTAKPDLPGRVSFSKPNMHNDLDSSDCDNDKQEVRPSISAPGPLTLPSFLSKVEPSDPAGQKKSVHFGSTAAEGEVLAETYEYPKCPSENCTCSTRSSSTTSTNEASAGEPKCACDAPSCRFAEPPLPLPTPDLQKAPTPELNVIREYKQAVGSVQVVKNHLGPEPLNNMEPLPAYLGKYGSPTKEKQNNLSETKNLASSGSTSANNNSSTAYRATSHPVARNFGAENNFLPAVQEDRRALGTTTSSDSVINNYLKVAAAPPSVGKKKENVKPASADPIARSSKPKLTTKMSGNPVTAPQGKLKKAISVGSLREERKLSEYNLDKVDSWMSMQEQQKEFEQKHKQGLEDLDEAQDNDSASQLSLKSNEDSRDSTYDEIVSVIKEIEEDKKRGEY